ncbi:MAG: glycosyltransferase family 2 protein [Nanoarchaeota archaeon]|nr:glycosyltransferase family 2 protein [Nanoarchaeota archaeon]
MMPKVSVIIPAWNRKSDLNRTLKSVFSQSYSNFEVFVVDNGSTDGSVEMVKTSFKKVHLIENRTNLGTSVAKNQGIKASFGKYVLFCDSDIEFVHDNCIMQMVNLLEQHPDVGAIGGEAYKINGNVETKKKLITMNCETSTIIMDSGDYELEDAGYVATCNCMMPRGIVEQCGGFDSSIIYAGEDKEMGIKVKKRGLRNVVDSRCLAYHYISQSTGHRNFFGFNKNRIRIVIKNYGFAHIFLLPLLDIICAVDRKKFSDMKGKKVDIMKWAGKGNMVSIGAKYAASLIAAYAWNIAHLPQTLIIRAKKINYLKE